MGKSSRLSGYEKATAIKLIAQRNAINYKFPIDCKIQVEYKFFLDSKRRRDVSNLIEAPQDCLIKAGIITDDSIIKKIIAEKFYDKKEKARCEISIRFLKKPNKEEDKNRCDICGRIVSDIYRCNRCKSLVCDYCIEFHSFSNYLYIDYPICVNCVL